MIENINTEHGDSGEDIKNELTASACHLMLMGVGLSGEVGDLMDALKKSFINRKYLNVENVIEELGDIEFYLEGIRRELQITRETTLKASIDLRYAGKSPMARKDKQ